MTKNLQYALSVARRTAKSRKARGWSAVELGLLAGITRQHVIKIETFKRPNISAAVVARLAAAFAVSSDWLLGLVDDPQGRCPCGDKK